jgi:hypothetical protein
MGVNVCNCALCSYPVFLKAKKQAFEIYHAVCVKVVLCLLSQIQQVDHFIIVDSFVGFDAP